MDNKISCPMCHFSFTPDLDSSGMCQCPSCESVLLIGSGQLGGVEFVEEFEECVEESMTIWEEVKKLDDSALEDEIAHEVATNDYMTGTFKIFTEMETSGLLEFETRKLAEGVYILMHTNRYFGYEQ